MSGGAGGDRRFVVGGGGSGAGGGGGGGGGVAGVGVICVGSDSQAILLANGMVVDKADSIAHLSLEK